MAGTLVIGTLSDGTNSTSSTNAIQGSAKAWVTYKSTSAQSIRASFNVSSVTYNAAGDYTINFTNALADTNYCTVGMGGSYSGSGYSVLANYSSVAAPTTTACRVREYNPSSPGNFDADYVGFAVFR